MSAPSALCPAISLAAFDGYPLEVALDEVAALGVTIVEPAFIRGYTTFDEGTFTTAEAGRVRGLLANRGLSARSLSAHMNLAEPNADTMLARRIAFAEALGATILITNAGPASERATIQKRIEAFVPRLEATTVSLALENPGHGRGDLVGHGQDGAAFVCELDHPSVGLNLDVGNFLTYAAGLEPSLSAARPYALHLHLKDVSGALDWRFVGLGDGLLDLQAVSSIAGDLPAAIELPLRLTRPGRCDPVRGSEAIPLPAIRIALCRSLAAWTGTLSSRVNAAVRG